MESLTAKELEANLAARRARLRRLEREVAEERAAIALLEQTQTLTLPNLLDTLPRELRDHIWGYCVAPGKVFLSKSRVAYDARFDDFDEYEKPHWQLLAVSRSIRHEAAKVLFEQNQFIWSHSTSGFRRLVYRDNASNYSYENDIRLNQFAYKHLRSVSITFDLRSPIQQNPLRNAAVMRADSSFCGTPWSSMDVATRRSTAHTYMFDDAYKEVQDLLDGVMDCKGLNSLELDFNNCYCPMGCCRPLREVMYNFYGGRLQPPAHFRIMGTRNQSERDIIIKILGRYNHAEDLKTTVVFEKYAASQEMQDRVYPFWCYLTEEDLDVKLERAELEVGGRKSAEDVC